MNKTTNIKEINDIYKRHSSRTDTIYKFVSQFGSFLNTRQDYGGGEMVTMVELHILTRIYDHPGTTITEVAKHWGRTLGAISQIVTKLQIKGLVERRKEDGNAKNVHLFTTEKGDNLVCIHKADVINNKQDKILQYCTQEEVEAFYKVMQLYTQHLL